MKNHDRFLVVTGFIFSQLYERLPWRISINFEDICNVFVTREDNDVMPWQEIFCATIKWLTDEGYISSDWENSNNLCVNLKLTRISLRSLLAFTKMDEPMLVGDVLVEAADSGNLEALRIYGRAALMASSWPNY